MTDTKNKRSKKTGSKGATKKRAKANQKLEENSPLNPVDLINALMMMRWKRGDDFLKEETMPVEHARVIIREMYKRKNQVAPHMCEMMLNDLIKAEIVRQGPQWDKSIAISKMTRHLQTDDKHIESETDNWLKYRPREEYGAGDELQRIVYGHYKYLRIKRGWIYKPPAREQSAILEETWRQAMQEPRVREILKGKDRWDVGRLEHEALGRLRYDFRRDPEIKELKRTFPR